MNLAFLQLRLYFFTTEVVLQSSKVVPENFTFVPRSLVYNSTCSEFEPGLQKRLSRGLLRDAAHEAYQLSNEFGKTATVKAEVWP